MPERKKIFLTGATGFIGSHLTSRLLQEGHDVTVMARHSKNVSARDRVVSILQEVGVTNFSNLCVFDGDISLPGLGLNESALKQLVLVKPH